MPRVNAADADLQARLRPRGSNQGGLRQYNERVVLLPRPIQTRAPEVLLAKLVAKRAGVQASRCLASWITS